MEFISLDVVLRSIGECVELQEWIKQGPDPVWMQNINEANFRYSEAAALLDHQLLMNQNPPLPRWLDIRDETGYPRPSDAAREDGMKFLLDQAKWYQQWLKFNQQFQLRKANAVGPLAYSPSGDYYREQCPRMPAASQEYEKRIHEIGFSPDDIIAFLNRVAIPHALKGVDLPVSALISTGQSPSSASSREITATNQSNRESTQITSKSQSHKTGGRGKRCIIEKAIQQAQAFAGEERFQTAAVFTQLVKLARDRAKEFPPLAGYKNGKVMYWLDGDEVEYKKKALGEYLSRRRQQVLAN